VPGLGIRREDKNEWERRAPLTPAHVAELVHEHGIPVAVQPSSRRVYADREYWNAGAELVEDLSACQVILGVKEVPPGLLIAGRPHLLFSHTVKGQPANMPLLRAALGRRITLIDYERIVDRRGHRLIFFGRHAGYAGAIDALWTLGRRMLAKGIETAFASVSQTRDYPSLDQASDFLARAVGARIRDRGLHPGIFPVVIGVTGGGNVAAGASEILDRLPVVDVAADDLPKLAGEKALSRHAIYRVRFRRDDRKDFRRHLPFLTVLINGIYWEPGEPRLVSREDLQRLWREAHPAPRLCVIADISCDVAGSIEATVQTTTPGEPVYVYDPESGQIRFGVEGRGPVILAVDNLPAELPRDATEHFGDSLFPFLGPTASADFDVPYEHLALPAAVLGAVVTHGGELAPGYRHLERPLRESGA